MEIQRIVVLDGIDILPDGFRIRCHDLRGQLPEIVMKNSGNTFKDKDWLSNAACKLIAMSRLRDRMVRFLPRSRLLPPTWMERQSPASAQGLQRGWQQGTIPSLPTMRFAGRL
jgi:hypothetical protein